MVPNANAQAHLQQPSVALHALSLRVLPLLASPQTTFVQRPKWYPGSIVIDQCFTNQFLNRLLCYNTSLPKHPPCKESCTTRRYLYDIDETISNTIEHVVRHIVLKCM